MGGLLSYIDMEGGLLLKRDQLLLWARLDMASSSMYICA